MRMTKHATIYATYLLLVWGLYRILFTLPTEVEEGIVKPLIWLLPLVFILKREKLGLGSLGLTFTNLFPAIYLSIGLGSIFVIEAIVANFIKYNGFSFNTNIGDKAMIYALVISLATAISEELAFRGYLFNRWYMVLKSEWTANLITTGVWTLMHVPVTVFIMKLALPEALVYLGLTAVFGLGSSFIFARTKNVASSILLHLLWSWPIILFR